MANLHCNSSSSNNGEEMIYFTLVVISYIIIFYWFSKNTDVHFFEITLYGFFAAAIFPLTLIVTILYIVFKRIRKSKGLNPNDM